MKRTSLIVALLVALSGPTLSGCDDPCTDLEVKLCKAKTPKMKKAFKKHCKLMQEPERREGLTGEYCTSILDHVRKRYR